jgi:hypothetical protein
VGILAIANQIKHGAPRLLSFVNFQHNLRLMIGILKQALRIIYIFRKRR